MKTLCALALSMLFPLAIGAATKDKHCVLRLHMEANLHDTVAFATSVHAKLSGKDIAIERVARISEKDVTAFYPYHAANGSYGVLLQLDEHGKMTLEGLSLERRGSLLFVFVNGRAITEFEIDKRVSDGKIYIPSGITEADIALMKKDWKLIDQKKKKR